MVGLSRPRGALRQLWRRVLLLAGRGVVTLTDDSPQLRTLQLQALADETLDDVEHHEPYGFSSHPHPKAEAIVLSLGGERQNAVVPVVSDRRYRPTGLQRGEVILFTDEDEAGAPFRVIFRRGRRLELHAGRSSIVMTDAGITMTAVRIDHSRAG